MKKKNHSFLNHKKIKFALKKRLVIYKSLVISLTRMESKALIFFFKIQNFMIMLSCQRKSLNLILFSSKKAIKTFKSKIQLWDVMNWQNCVARCGTNSPSLKNSIIMSSRNKIESDIKTKSEIWLPKAIS